ncbi:SUMF1/EgtB/PvdO family nonheme iron enzyme [Streptomyces scabiei]|uniref:formylglycine-generating enzyme family protein n=1 Tax=Streptomyces scabiei TaxID=1930 RepID=UPI00298F6D8B|nr:SUMF1/EgtB/PvdO family nonheme iron enzyme [Streptomyces scabiei]MDW8804347.1 SUMF1/EgtB/PvdO family nonheme iron enzyme [Streptomyces scabiei]
MSEPMKRYREEAVTLPDGFATIAPALVTNRVCVEILNTLQPYNGDAEGGYRILNVHNPAQPIKRDSDTGGYHVSADLADHPAVGVTLPGAQYLAAALGGRLPTVAEWEHAATCGGRYRYPWGDEPPTREHANHAEHVGSTTETGQYPASPWGLYDMAGNVGEWCLTQADEEWDPAREYPVKGGAWNKPAAQLDPRFTRRKWGRIGTVGIGLRVIF